ncbi:1381_t:CDS:1, partial [Cetraspora pellucida]
MSLTEIRYNFSNLIELRVRKQKQQVKSTSKQSLSQENISNEKCEKNANV